MSLSLKESAVADARGVVIDALDEAGENSGSPGEGVNQALDNILGLFKSLFSTPNEECKTVLPLDPSKLLGDFGSLLAQAGEWRLAGAVVPETVTLVALFARSFLKAPLLKEKVTIGSLVRKSVLAGPDCLRELLNGFRVFLDSNRQENLPALVKFLGKSGWGFLYPWSGSDLWEKTDGGDRWSELMIHINAEEPSKKLLESIVSALNEALERDVYAGVTLLRKCGARNLKLWVEKDIKGAGLLIERFSGASARSADTPLLF